MIRTIFREAKQPQPVEKIDNKSGLVKWGDANLYAQFLVGLFQDNPVHGGVINFITKRDYQGLDIAVENTYPSQQSGQIKRFTFSGGQGSLAKDGYNLWFSLDNKSQASVKATDRAFGATGVIPSAGLNKTSGTTFPANFNYYNTAGAIKSGNITLPNCAPPGSIFISGTTCRYDYTSAIDIIPETENLNINAKGTFRLSDSRLLTVEAVHSENTNIARVAPLS